MNTVSNGTPDPATLTLVGTNGVNFHGLIKDGGGPLTIVQDNPGTTTLDNPSNDFSGGVIVKEGTVSTGSTPDASDTNTAFGSNPWIILGDTEPNTNSASLDLGTGVVTNGVLLAPGTTGDLVIGVQTNADATITGGIIGTNDLILSGSPGGLLTISGNPIDNVGTLTIEGNPTADGSAGPVVIDSVIGTNISALTIGTNTPAGTNVVTLSGTNLYTGTTTVGGKLILAATGSIAESTNIVIPAGGIVDVSAITNFSLSPANTLTALGRGTNVGDTAATLIGAAGGTVSLGSSAVTLDIDGSNPALFVSQGTLVLNQNPFTINSASPLGYGDYVIAQSTDGITGTGPFTVDGTVLGVGSTGTIMVVGNQLILHVNTPPLVYTDDSPLTNTPTGDTTGIIFTSTNNTLVNGTNGTLTVGPGGITATPGAGGGTIGGESPNGLNVALDGSQTWTNNSAGPITLVNTVSNGTPDPATLTLVGTNGFNFDGPVTDGGGPLTIVQDTTGTTTLNNTSNDFTGGVIVDEGTVATGSTPNATDTNTAFGSNPWIILGDTEPNTNSASLDLGTGVVTNGVLLAPGTTGDLVIGVQTNANATITGGIIGTNDLILSGSPGGLLTISGNPIDNVGTLTIEGNPTADGSAGPVVINSTIGTNVTALTIGTNTPAGTNVVTLSGTNLYTGTTTVGGTLILAATGSIAESTNIVIPAGGIVDVSAITNFTLSASNTLTALGRGTNVGDTAATLIGAAGGTVSLGSSPVTLDIDGTNPALFVSQGTLVLNTNPFTINSANPLTNGTYVLAQATDGITGTGPYTVNGTAIPTNYVAVITVLGDQLVMTLSNLPPVAAPLAIPLNLGISLKLPISNLVSNWSDPNNFAVTLVSVQTNSTLGKLVTLSGNTIFYPKATANDTITYTIRDSAGATATGVINIVLTPLTGQATPTIVLNGGTATVSFAGIPGFTYFVQRTASLTPATWTTVSTNTAPTGGTFQFIDLNPPQPTAFYRLSTAP